MRPRLVHNTPVLGTPVAAPCTCLDLLVTIRPLILPFCPAIPAIIALLPVVTRAIRPAPEPRR